jgi:hypothetical protein
VTFFFDNHHSQWLVALLREQGVDAVHLRDEFDQGTDDKDWLPEVGRRGWILVTGDHRILRRKEEKRVFHQARLISFFEAKEYNNKHRETRIKWVRSRWAHIEEHAAQAQPGDSYEVPWKGRIIPLALTKRLW